MKYNTYLHLLFSRNLLLLLLLWWWWWWWWWWWLRVDVLELRLLSHHHVLILLLHHRHDLRVFFRVRCHHAHNLIELLVVGQFLLIINLFELLKFLLANLSSRNRLELFLGNGFEARIKVR